MWDNETDDDDEDRTNQDKTDEFYQLSQACKNIQISQLYEMKLSITTIFWADWQTYKQWWWWTTITIIAKICYDERWQE